MAELAVPPLLLSVDEYLELEQGSSIKHEYVEGGAWQRADLVNDGAFHVPCPGIELTISGIYRGL